jgi:hypothetical protein
MRKSLTFKLLCLLIFIYSSGVVMADDFDRFCNPPTEMTSQLVCGLAREQRVSPLKAGIAMTMASLQMTGTFCNFSFNQNFLERRMKVENDYEIAKVVKHLISVYRGKPPPGFNGDQKVFCKMQHESFGPRSTAKIFL